MHVIEARDRWGFKTRFDLFLIDYRKELERWGHLTGEALRQAMPPCWNMEHRLGLCPFGLCHQVQHVHGHNTIVRGPKESIVKRMSSTPGGAMDLQITMVATGTSSAATAQTDTQLAAEFFRKAPTDNFPLAPDALQVFWNFTASEANAGSALQEHGMIAGGATATPGSGSMLSRFLQTYAKNAGNTGSGAYSLTVTG